MLRRFRGVREEFKVSRQSKIAWLWGFEGELLLEQFSEIFKVLFLVFKLL